jgi:hypothetical protein
MPVTRAQLAATPGSCTEEKRFILEYEDMKIAHVSTMIRRHPEWRTAINHMLENNYFLPEQPTQRIRFALRTGNRYLIETLFNQHPELHTTPIYIGMDPLRFCIGFHYDVSADILLPMTPDAAFLRTGKGMTVVMSAIRSSSDDFCDRILSRNGPNGLNIVIGRKSVLSVAQCHSMDRFLKILRHPELDPPSWNHPDEYSVLPRIAKMFDKHPDARKVFMDRWGLKTIFGKYQVSMIHLLAVRGFHDDPVWSLPNIDQVDGCGNGTAHFLARSSHTTMVARLLDDKRIDWHRRNNRGQPSFFWIEDPVMVDLFWEKGLIDCRLVADNKTFADKLAYCGRYRTLEHLTKLSSGSRSIAPSGNHLVKRKALLSLLEHPKVVRFRFCTETYGHNYFRLKRMNFAWDVETVRLTLPRLAQLGDLDKGMYPWFKSHRNQQIQERVALLSVYDKAETRRMEKVEHPNGLDTFVRESACEPGLLRIIFSYL